MGDLVELLTHFKKKNSTIFINYYKREMTGDVLPQEESRQQDNKNQPKNENENKEEEKKDEENKEEEKKEEEKKEEEKKEEEKKEEENKEEEKKEEKKETKKAEAKTDNKNKSKNDKNDKNKGPSKEMQMLNKLYYTTDIYFFDTEQAVKLFDKHYKAFTTENPKKNINKSKVYDYFIQGIASGTEPEVHGDKAGLFLDEFNKFIFVHASKKSANKQSYDSQPYPKVNHNNLSVVSEYKNIVKSNKDDSYTLFLSSIVIFMAQAAPKCNKAEVFYPAFLIGVELVKRKTEYIKRIKDEEKKKIQDRRNILIDDNFYKVKINPSALTKELEKFAQGEKEGGFVLDCTNKNKSSMKVYVSLYDYHLKSFFSNQKVRKK